MRRLVVVAAAASMLAAGLGAAVPAAAATTARSRVSAISRQAPDRRRGGPGRVGRPLFLAAGYYEQTWLQLGHAFTAWANSHSATAGKDIVSLYEASDTPGNDNEFAVYNRVQCTDIQSPQSWARRSKDNRKVNRNAQFETWSNAWYNAPCLYWPAPARTPEHITGKKTSSALLIDETLDAATPFEGSQEVRKLFPHSVLLAGPGGSARAAGPSGALCVHNTMGGSLAPCRSRPRPRPGPPASRRRRT